MNSVLLMLQSGPGLSLGEWSYVGLYVSTQLDVHLGDSVGVHLDDSVEGRLDDSANAHLDDSVDAHLDELLGVVHQLDELPGDLQSEQPV